MGRRTRDSQFAYTWDWRGRLRRVDVLEGVPGQVGNTIEYEYDASGRMVTRKVSDSDPEDGEDENPAFVSKRLYLWDGAGLAAEIGLNEGGEPIWRKQFVPGPSGFDDSPQVYIETGLQAPEQEATETALFSFIRDEMGTVIGLVEDRELEPGDAMPLLGRYFYTPYGEVFLESGPKLVSVDFSLEATTVDEIGQTLDDPLTALPGSLLLRTTMALDYATLEGGVILKRRVETEPGEFSWVEIGAGEYVIGRDEDDPTWSLIMPLTGWEAGDQYSVTVLGSVKDELGRKIQLPDAEALAYVHTFNIPDPIAEPPEIPAGFPRQFPIEFDTVAAAGETFDQKYPGGQNHLFQGLWTDPITGMSYARNRWYDARNARWLSEDSLGAIDSPNLYAFVGWGPQSLTDPLGTIGDSPAYDRFLATKDMSREDRKAFNQGYDQGMAMGAKAVAGVAAVGASIAYAPIGIVVGAYYLQDAVAVAPKNPWLAERASVSVWRTAPSSRPSADTRLSAGRRSLEIS